MQDLEAKRLRESLVEYENYLNEIRQVTRKNVEALDVIQADCVKLSKPARAI